MTDNNYALPHLRLFLLSGSCVHWFTLEEGGVRRATRRHCLGYLVSFVYSRRNSKSFMYNNSYSRYKI